MTDFMKRVQGWGLVGALVGLTAAVISKFYPSGGLLNLKLASPISLDIASKLKAGLDTTISEKVFGFFNGLLPINGNVWLMAALTGAILMILGRYLLDWIPFFKPRTTMQKMTLVLFYGSVVVMLYLGTLSPALNVTFISVLGTLLVYFAILALISLLVINTMKVKIPE